MRAGVECRKGRFRVIDIDTRKLLPGPNNSGPCDGGGHTDEQKAIRQAAHINEWLDEKKPRGGGIHARR